MCDTAIGMNAGGTKNVKIKKNPPKNQVDSHLYAKYICIRLLLYTVPSSVHSHKW